MILWSYLNSKGIHNYKDVNNQTRGISDNKEGELVTQQKLTTKHWVEFFSFFRKSKSQHKMFFSSNFLIAIATVSPKGSMFRVLFSIAVCVKLGNKVYHTFLKQFNMKVLGRMHNMIICNKRTIYSTIEIIL